MEARQEIEDQKLVDLLQEKIVTLFAARNMRMANLRIRCTHCMGEDHEFGECEEELLDPDGADHFQDQLHQDAESQLLGVESESVRSGNTQAGS